MMRRYIQEHGIQLVHPYDVPTVIFGVPMARAFRSACCNRQPVVLP